MSVEGVETVDWLLLLLLLLLLVVVVWAGLVGLAVRVNLLPRMGSNLNFKGERGNLLGSDRKVISPR